MPVSPMTPEAFIKKWRASTLSERSGAHSHFNDLCALLSVDPPAAVDPEGEWFTFEKGGRPQEQRRQGLG